MSGLESRTSVTVEGIRVGSRGPHVLTQSRGGGSTSDTHQNKGFRGEGDVYIKKDIKLPKGVEEKRRKNFFIKYFDSNKSNF